MTWLAWRQYRTGLLIALAILAAMAMYLIPTGLDNLSEYRSSGLDSCLESGRDCVELRDRFTNGFNSVERVVGWFNFAPAIIGMLLAAPLVAEFEQRTHRLAWTQSITRERWLGVQIAMALSGVIVFSVVLTAIMTWWYAPLDQTVTLAGKDLGSSFEFEGAMPLAYTSFALALALAAGAWTRRTLAAMPIALVGFVVARLGALTVLRQGPTSDVSFEAPAGRLAVNEATRDMERFWTVQAIEAAIFLSLAAILLGVTVWAVRRRG